MRSEYIEGLRSLRNFAGEYREAVGSFQRKLREEFSFMRGNLLTLIVSWLFVYFTFAMTTSFQPQYFTNLGAPPSVIGMMGSVGAAVLGLVRIPGAYIADRYGRRQIIVMMTFVIAFSFLFFIFAPDWRFALIGMVISNLSLIYQPALDAILADSVPSDKRGVGFAATMVIPNIPTIIAPTIAGFLVDIYSIDFGMRVVYSVVFFCMLAAAFIRMVFLRETIEQPQRINFREVFRVFENSFSAMRDAWKDMPKTLKFVTAAFLVSAFEEPMFRTFTALYANDIVMVRGLEWGIVNTVYIAITILFGFPLGKIVDVTGRRRAILSAYILFFPANILFLISSSFYHLVIVFFMFALGSCLIMPAYNALLADLIPKEKRGRILGTIITLNILATVPASALSGVLYEISPSYPFILTQILGVIVSFIIFFKVKDPKNREE
ncbi:MAG: MFS transporter [Candidatus Bathyarchaeota archaeon]